LVFLISVFDASTLFTEFRALFLISTCWVVFKVKDKDELIRQIEAQNRLLERAKEKQRQIQIVNDELDFTQGKLLSQVLLANFDSLCTKIDFF